LGAKGCTGDNSLLVGIKYYIMRINVKFEHINFDFFFKLIL